MKLYQLRHMQLVLHYKSYDHQIICVNDEIWKVKESSGTYRLWSFLSCGMIRRVSNYSMVFCSLFEKGYPDLPVANMRFQGKIKSYRAATYGMATFFLWQLHDTLIY